MTELEWVESRIRNLDRLLRKAEEHYHITVTHGSMEDMRSALAECQELRAKLIEYLHRRDELEVRLAELRRQRDYLTAESK